jgi:hypothetical protein
MSETTPTSTNPRSVRGADATVSEPSEAPPQQNADEYKQAAKHERYSQIIDKIREKEARKRKAIGTKQGFRTDDLHSDKEIVEEAIRKTNAWWRRNNPNRALAVASAQSTSVPEVEKIDSSGWLPLLNWTSFAQAEPIASQQKPSSHPASDRFYQRA